MAYVFSYGHAGGSKQCGPTRVRYQYCACERAKFSALSAKLVAAAKYTSRLKRGHGWCLRVREADTDRRAMRRRDCGDIVLPDLVVQSEAP